MNGAQLMCRCGAAARYSSPVAEQLETGWCGPGFCHKDRREEDVVMTYTEEFCRRDDKLWDYWRLRMARAAYKAETSDCPLQDEANGLSLRDLCDWAGSCPESRLSLVDSMATLNRIGGSVGQRADTAKAMREAYGWELAWVRVRVIRAMETLAGPPAADPNNA